MKGASRSSVTCGPSPTPTPPLARLYLRQTRLGRTLPWPRAALRERPEVGGAGTLGPPGQLPADGFVCDTSLPETPADGGGGGEEQA